MQDIFHDVDVDRAREQHGRIVVKDAEILLPSALGFCGGVLHAVQRLRKALCQEPNRRFWLLGEIIHNDTVNRHFEQQGVTILPETEIDQILDRAEEQDAIVIPAFGIPRGLEVQLRTCWHGKARIIDTTCGYIRRLWRFAEKMAARGDTLLIHGKPHHPEMRATLSRALTPRNTVIVIPDMATASAVAAAVRARSSELLPSHCVRNPQHLTFARMALVNQTTMLHEETRSVEAMMRDAVQANGGCLHCADSVCAATQDRQTAAVELCGRNCQLILVVGGFSSSNTSQLYRLANSFGRAYFIGNAHAIAKDKITHFLPDTGTLASTRDWLPRPVRRIGLLAGASCPPGDIGEVIRTLKRVIIA